jgi:hypothetical protein
MLVDVDDGTLDGNARTNADGSDYTEEDADGDGGPGDGRVDMSDFRRWRDWLLQAEGAAGARLDGSPRHPKRDVNVNGRFAADGDAENLYPRGDFNGDGQLSRTATRAVAGAMGGQAATDLAVLQKLFADPDHEASELPGLVNSADVTVNAALCLAQPGVARVRTRVFATGGPVPLVGRTHDAATPVRVYTLPVDPAGHTVLVEALAADGSVKVRAERDLGAPAPGGDTRWSPACSRLTITPAEVTLAPQAVQRFTAALGDGSSPDVTWQATGGRINYGGYYTAPAMPGTYRVTARSTADTSLVDTAVVRVEGAVRVMVARQRTEVSPGAGYKFAGCTGLGWDRRPPYPTNDFRRDTVTLGNVSLSGSSSWTESVPDNWGGPTTLDATAAARTTLTVVGRADSLTAVRGSVEASGTASHSGLGRCVLGVQSAPRAEAMMVLTVHEPVAYELTASCPFSGVTSPVLSVTFSGNGSTGSYFYSVITPTQPGPRRGTIAAGEYLLMAVSQPYFAVRSDLASTAGGSAGCTFALEFGGSGS